MGFLRLGADFICNQKRSFNCSKLFSDNTAYTEILVFYAEFLVFLPYMATLALFTLSWLQFLPSVGGLFLFEIIPSFDVYRARGPDMLQNGCL